MPEDWLGAARQVDEDGLFELAEHLPQEAAEALLDLAVGATPKLMEVLTAHEDAFAHPDAQRRFRVVANVDELRQALEYPWERWAIFLHPAQRELVERRFGERRGWRARRAPARRWSPCTGRHISCGAIQRRGC